MESMALPLDQPPIAPPAVFPASDRSRKRALVLPAALYVPVAFVLAGILAALIAYNVACVRFASLGADQSWLLYAASRVLAGFTLDGPRIVESNPPLIVWFSAVPDLVAGWLYASPLLVLKIIVVAMAAGSAGWCVRLLRAAGLARTPFLLCLGFFSVAAVELSRDFITYGQFSEREQLVILFALPYLLYSCCRLALKVHTGERLLLGVAAGIGICLKPQQLLILVVFEIFLLVYTRRLRWLVRTELLAAALTIGCYVLGVFLTTPYFHTLVPLLRDTYWAFADATQWELARIAFVNGRFLIGLVLAIGFYRYLKFPIAPLALLAASLGAGLAYMQQNAAWDYHLYPAKALFACAMGWIIVDLLSGYFGGMPATTLRRGLAFAAITVVLVAVSLPRFFARERLQADLAAKFRGDLFHFVHHFPAQTPFYVFSTSNGEFFQEVVEDHLVWTSRYNHLWMLPAIAENEQAFAGGPPARKALTRARVDELSTKLRSDIAEDFRINKPEIVVVERCDQVSGCQGIHHYTFAMLPWFLKSPAFAAEWSHYQPLANERHYDVYTRKVSPN